jgi:VWFA-related protein
MTRRLHVASLLVLGAAAALSAGQNATAPTPPTLQAPTFKVRIDYVEVDVGVTDASGNPVRSLTEQDFQVLEDGKAQTIATFGLVDIPVERYERPLFSAEPIEPDVATNSQVLDGRLYVMVIDDLHTGFMRTERTKAAARKFIVENFGSNDLMAVVHTAGPSDSGQQLTNSKRLLLAAVDKTFGQGLAPSTLTRTQEYQRTADRRNVGDPIRDPDLLERVHNAQRTLGLLEEVSNWFVPAHGRRKSILFFSEGLNYELSEPIGTGPVAMDYGTQVIAKAVRDTIAAATRANVSIYGIDPRGIAGLSENLTELQSAPEPGLDVRSLSSELQLSQESLRWLSEETGGFAAVNASDFRSLFDRVVRDNSAYYVIAYYPPPDDKPGKIHDIQVRVNRQGVTVRTRRAYVTPQPAAPAALPKNASDARKMMTPEVAEAIDMPVPVSGLTIHSFAAPFTGPPPNASVLIGVEIDGRDVAMNTNDKLVVSSVAVDTQGKIRGSRTTTAVLRFSPDTKALVAGTGMRVMERMDLPAGRYQIRVAAHDTGGGKVGSVLYNLEVPDFTKNDLSMSGILISAGAATFLPSLTVDEQSKQALSGPPTAIRTFASNDEIGLFVETYDNRSSKPHKVDVTATVTTDEGRVVFTNNETRDTSELGGKRGGFGYLARIPLKGLSAGIYVLTVSARSSVGDGSPVRRQIQFKVAS